MKLRVFVDGACSGNPGPGGWACVICSEKSIDRIAGHVEFTTNNCMELTAAVQGVACALREDKYKKYDEIQIVSDSVYVIDAFMRRKVYEWQDAGWKTVSGEDIAHKELWKEMLACVRIAEQKGRHIVFEKVEGHSLNTFNEIADRDAKAQAQWASNMVRLKGGSE